MILDINHWIFKSKPTNNIPYRDARNLQIVEGAIDISDRSNPTYSVKRIIIHEYDKYALKYHIGPKMPSLSLILT